MNIKKFLFISFMIFKHFLSFVISLIVLKSGAAPDFSILRKNAADFSPFW